MDTNIVDGVADAAQGSFVARIRHCLCGPQTVSQIREMVAAVSGITESEVEQVISYADGVTASVIRCFEDVTFEGDDSEAQSLLPATWLSLRLEWTRYNAQLQYQCVTQGFGAPWLMAKSGTLSCIAGILEGFLDKKTHYWAVKIAAEPTGLPQRIDDLRDTFTSFSSRCVSATSDLLDKMYSLSSTDLERLRPDQIQKHISDIAASSGELVTEATALPTEVFEGLLESRICRHLAASSLSVVVSRKASCTRESLNFELCNRVLQVIEAWSHHMLSQKQQSPEAREAVGKNHHINFTWDVSESESTVVFELCDDGTGSEAGSFDAARWEAQAGLRLDVEGTPGQGNVIRLTCDSAELIAHEYVVIHVRVPTGVYRFAMQSSKVEKIFDIESSQVGASLETISDADVRYPVLAIHDCLGIAAGDQPGRQCVVIRGKGQRAACLVADDALRGCRSKLLVHRDVRNSPSQRGFILHQGGLVPVVDAERIMSAYMGETNPGADIV